MKLVQAGDTAQLAVLFERYHLPLFRYLLCLTRNRELSEDLVQEVFFRVIKYARTFDPRQTFPAWLYGMARNAWFDQQHKRRGELSGTELDEIRSPEPMPEEMITHKQDMAFLQQALLKLPDEKREVLVLSRFHDLRYEDIARILQCEVGAVKVRVYRALKELREKFCELRGEKLYDV
ncbi:MAG TPA: RNA polymerase sigma factor [Bryobacteraceae bacterium]|jgi:RNA polymerase sigma-70 factor (ECF subfamily)